MKWLAELGPNGYVVCSAKNALSAISSLDPEYSTFIQRIRGETMSTNPSERASAPTPLVQITSKEELIRRKLEEERARLAREMGIDLRPRKHFAKPVEHLFTKDQRDHTTILVGGLTWKHEYLIHGALEGLGYKCEAIPTPDVQAFQLGKEYGNNGQCNPTYFTVGNLVQHLQTLESKGLSR